MVCHKSMWFLCHSGPGCTMYKQERDSTFLERFKRIRSEVFLTRCLICITQWYKRAIIRPCVSDCELPTWAENLTSSMILFLLLLALPQRELVHLWSSLVRWWSSSTGGLVIIASIDSKQIRRRKMCCCKCLQKFCRGGKICFLASPPSYT